MLWLCFFEGTIHYLVDITAKNDDLVLSQCGRDNRSQISDRDESITIKIIYLERNWKRGRIIGIYESCNERGLTFDLLLLRCLTRDCGQAPDVLRETNLIIVIGIKDTEDTIY